MTGGVWWLAGVNLVIWSGIFWYLLRIEGKLRQASNDLAHDEHGEKS
ncbi:MAG: CcmD family protein [Acidobacteriota bacterium]